MICYGQTHEMHQMFRYISNRKNQGEISMQKKTGLLLILCLIMMLFASAAHAGYNDVCVAADGEGIAVYTSSSGSKKAGVLYNGYQADLSLESTNDLYSCWLTRDVTVWLDQDKAEKNIPRDSHGWRDLRAWENVTDVHASYVFLAKVTQEDAPLYTSTNHKTLTAKHAPGTLLRVCGEFGDDYFVDMYAYSGFIPKSAVEFYRGLTVREMGPSSSLGLEATTCTVYTDGTELALGYSATGYCDETPTYVKDGDQVKVLQELGDWAQLSNHAFIETRFLDPDGDHSIRYATVRTSGVLNRLNVRSTPDEDGYVSAKLCSGAKVQVPCRTDEWAAVFFNGESGGERIYGSVMTDYLVFDDTPVENGTVRVRLSRLVYGGNRGNQYRATCTGGSLPAGTELTVIGVEGNFDADMGDSDQFFCLTDEGRLVVIWDQEGVLEPVDPFDITVKVRSNVRFREKPDQNSRAMRTLSAGTKVKVLLRGEGWTMIEYKGQTGYVMSRYLNFP